MRTSLRLVLAVTLLASSSGASAVRDADAAPPTNLDNNNNNDSPTPTPYSPFLPGLILDNIPFLHHHHASVATAAAAPPPPLSAPTSASTTSPSDAAASPSTTPAPFYDNIFKRQASSSSSSSGGGGTTCPASYSACAALGAPGLCCHRSSNCAVDQAGHVACCPSGAVCTGSIRASSTVAPGYGVTTVTEGGTASSSLGSFVLPSSASTGTGTGGGFIVVASTTVAQPNAGGAGRRGLIPVVGWWFY